MSSAPAADSSAITASLPAGIGDPGPTSWHRLDPLTRLVASVATLVAALVLGGIVCPALLALVAVMVPAAVAGVLTRLLRLALISALPLALSVALVNVLFTPEGGTVVAEIGPIRITEAGIALAGEVVVRVFVIAGAVALFYLTTPPAHLRLSLQAHGLSARLAFVVHNAVAMIPRIAERADEVGQAQRARGFDTEAGLSSRIRGVLALSAPTVLGAIAEAETRTLALETRGLTEPGPHTMLWQPSDGRTQRLARWAMVAAVAAIGAARLLGVPLPC